jgi:hypothetical protein
VDSFLWLLQVTSVFGGALLIYGSLFLYEDEEQRIQNILENWWIRIDDARTSATHAHTALTRAAAELARSGLDRVFGPRLLSFRAISVSGLLSLASFHFTATYLSGWAQANIAVDVKQLDLKTPADAIVALFMMFTAFLLVLAVPTQPLFMHAVSLFGVLVIALSATIRTLRHLPQIYFAILVAMLGILALFARHPDFVGMPYMVLVIVFAGIFFDFCAIAVTRALIQWQSSWWSFRRITAAAALELSIGVALIAAPIYVGSRIMRAAHGTSSWYSSIAGWSILLSTLTNVASAAISFSFFGALTLLAVHRVAWPAIERPLYQLARLGVFQSKATRTALFALGVATAMVGSGHGGDVASVLLSIFQSG